MGNMMGNMIGNRMMGNNMGNNMDNNMMKSNMRTSQSPGSFNPSDQKWFWELTIGVYFDLMVNLVILYTLCYIG